ncbi:P-loop containing nucleoside triphosphate hydrolase protein [Xylariaceae sp. AK1471]|nr:P-loop containing nucleoside triphosphate hydrolase protein [Xylariaceae sp. AK1471]
MSNRDEKIGSMILSEDETRYFRALLAWEPTHAEDAAKMKPVPERPLAGEFRILILGSKGCGKTAILTRFCKGSFTGEGQPPNPDYEQGCQRKIEIKDQVYKIDALELAPSHLFEGQYLRHAVAITQAAVLTYDVRSRESFVLIQELHQRIQEALVADKRQHYGLVLVGNKADGDEDNKEESRRMVTEGEGYELACGLNGGRTRCAFRETSARSGENVESVFVLLGTELLKLRRLTQQRREQAEDLARMEAMGRGDGKDLDASPKKVAKWRVWARPWFRRASQDAGEKAAVD